MNIFKDSSPKYYTKIKKDDKEKALENILKSF